MNYFKRTKAAAAAATSQCKLTSGCRKHPKHRQSPGVCSLCLGEKLSQLSSSPSSFRGTIKTKMESSASASSMSSSSSDSSCSSPHQYISMKGTSVNSMLFKSRTTTIGFVPKMKGKEEDYCRKTIESGFLSKFLRPKRKEGLVHSF